MKSQLETLASQADILGHDFDDEKDGHLVDYLIGMLGEFFPVCVLKKVATIYSERLDRIENQDIPDLLLENGMASLVTSNGLSVGLKTEYSPKIEDAEKFYAWMDEMGAGHLWKANLKFEKSVDISPIEDIIRNLGISYERKSEIHPQTLKKFIRDWVEGGGNVTQVPQEAGKVGMFTHATIKRV